MPAETATPAEATEAEITAEPTDAAAVEEIPAATTGEEVVNVEGEVAETTDEVPAETVVTEVPPESTDT